MSIYYDIQKPGEKKDPVQIKDAVEIMTFAMTLPFRYSSRLWCLKKTQKNSFLNNSIVGVSTRFFSNFTRVRTKIHRGSDLELQYQLQSLGLPTEDFPIDTEGNVRQDVIDRWFQEQWSKCKQAPAPSVLSPTAMTTFNTGKAAFPNEEESGDTFAIDSAMNFLPFNRPNPDPPMVQPAMIQLFPNDVLFGRGVGYQNHPGNVRFRGIMDGYKEQYDSVPRSKRRIMMVMLREAMKASGSRFLRMNKSRQWEECNAAEIDTKIGQFFRSLRKFKKGKSEDQNSS